MEWLEKKKCLNKLTLQVFAMVVMVIDHVGAALLPEVRLLRCIGRLAFPIFAYFIAEGYARTHNFKKYLLRMAIFAALSEIPFDFMNLGRIWVGFMQNVLWTFCIALLCLRWSDKLRQKHGGTLLFAADMVLVSAVGFTAGELLFTDYGGWGVLLVIGFFLCRELPGYYRYGGELLCMVIFAVIAIGGIEALALLSLPLLWLYNGKPGSQSKAIQYACYAFYPVHLAVIGILAVYIL